MDKMYLNQALKLAKPWLGRCAPNPAVGALLVKDGHIIAIGCHRGCGEAHAEIEAIKQAGENCVGATLYTTLEPCCHWGKTPPCSEQIIKAGIRRLVYAYEDPNPHVSGKGIKACQAAGIECVHVDDPDINQFYRAYHYWHRTGMSWAIFKIAITLDGKTARADGKPLLLTGDKLNQLTHQYRQQSDAILTTVATVIQDDPQLNCRLENTTLRKPLYIIDTHARCPLDARIFQTTESITLFHAPWASEDNLQQLRAHQVQCFPITTTTQGLDLGLILQFIGEQGRHQCWIEAGGGLLASMHQAKLLQQTLLFLSNQILAEEGLTGLHSPLDFRTAKTIQWLSLGDECYADLTWGSEDVYRDY